MSDHLDMNNTGVPKSNNLSHQDDPQCEIPIFSYFPRSMDNGTHGHHSKDTPQVVVMLIGLVVNKSDNNDHQW